MKVLKLPILLAAMALTISAFAKNAATETKSFPEATIDQTALPPMVETGTITSEKTGQQCTITAAVGGQLEYNAVAIPESESFVPNTLSDTATIFSNDPNELANIAQKKYRHGALAKIALPAIGQNSIASMHAVDQHEVADTGPPEKTIGGPSTIFPATQVTDPLIL